MIKNFKLSNSDLLSIGPDYGMGTESDDAFEYSFDSVEDPGWLARAASTLRQENPISSAIMEWQYESDSPDDPKFNVYDHLTEEQLPYAEAYLGVHSPEQKEMKDAHLLAQLNDKRIMHGGGAETVMWSLIAGLGDPVTLASMLIPGGAMVQAGKGALATAGIVALGGAVEVGASEIMLHKSQDIRTKEQSAMNLGATVLLGGTLGGLVGLSAKTKIKAYDQANKDIKDIIEHGGMEDINKVSDRAATYDVETGEVLKSTKDLADEGAKLLGLGINPLIRGLKSDFVSARNGTNRLSDHNFYLGYNDKKVIQPDGSVRIIHERTASSVEAATNSMQGGFSAKYLRSINENFKAFRKEGGKTNQASFNFEVGKALRRGDAHPNPHVVKAAQLIRKDVLNPIKKMYQKIGKLPPSLQAKFAKSYLPRVYNIAAINKNPAAWNSMLVDHFRAGGRTLKEAEEIAFDVTDNILNTPAGRLPNETGVHTDAGFLKARELDIQDEILEGQGWLVTNVDEVLEKYLRTMIPEYNMIKEFGDINMTKVISDMDAELKVMLAENPSVIKQNKIKGKYNNARRDLEYMRDILLGKYVPTVDFARNYANQAAIARGITFTAQLGMMTISAIADIARPIMQHGVVAWAKALPRAFLYFAKQTKMARMDLEDFGIGVESLLNGRAYLFADIQDMTGATEKFTRTFAKYSGMNGWNSYWKKIAAFTAQNRFIKDAQNYKGLSTAKKTRLAKAGIDEDLALRITKEYKKHGEMFHGGHHANTKNWVDRKAASEFERILIKDVDNTIVTPGIGDRPIFLSTTLGKNIGQFKAFFLAAHNQVMIPLAQQLSRGDMSAVQGIVAGISFGMVSEYVRLQLSGKGDEFQNYSMEDWAKAGLDRSGMIGLPMELYNAADRLMEGKISQQLGLSEGSRYYNRNLAGTVLGPSASYIQDATTLLYQLMESGDMTSGDIRAIRRLMPYQNMFYLRILINKLEASVAKNAKKTRRKRGSKDMQ